MTDKDESPYVVRIKQRGLEVYDPQRAALMMTDPPPQPEGRKIDDIPLFMRKRMPANFPDNSHLPMYGHGKLESFKGTPDEVALEFKNKGNDFFRLRKWWDAREAYIEAFEICPSDPKLQEVILLNMAAANIELKYWPGVLVPSAEALTLNLKSTKAYYRAARALIHYKRYEEAIDCCKRVLAFDPCNEAILELMDDPNLGGKVPKQAKVEAAYQALEKAYKENLFIILQSQPLKLEPRNFPYLCPAIPKNGGNSNLFSTVNFKYPERNALDVFNGVGTNVCIKKLLLSALPGPNHPPTTWCSEVYFDPLDTTAEHARLVKLEAEKATLEYMHTGGKHPLWDPACQYFPHNISIYLETYKRQVLKIECTQTVGRVLQMVAEKPDDDKVCLEGGAIVFSIFRPGCKAEKLWLEAKGRKGFALAHPKYKETNKIAMLKSGQLRGWVLNSPRDNLEEVSVAARSQILENTKVVNDRS